MSNARHDSGLAVLRVVLGVVMVAHGWQKLTTAGFEGVGGMFTEMGVPLAAVTGPLVMVVELVAGALLVLGLATRVAAALVAAVGLGAIVFVHAANGFYATEGGYELVLLIAAAAVALVLTGPGRFALDATLGRSRPAERDREQERVPA